MYLIPFSKEEDIQTKLDRIAANRDNEKKQVYDLNNMINNHKILTVMSSRRKSEI